APAPNAPQRVASHACRPRAQNGDGYGCDEMRVNARTYQVIAEHPSETTARQWALLRAAELTLAAGAVGFTITADDSHEADTVRWSSIVGRGKRKTPVPAITIDMLPPDELGHVQPGTLAYDARMLVASNPR